MLPLTASISFTAWLPVSATNTSPLASTATELGPLNPLPSVTAQTRMESAARRNFLHRVIPGIRDVEFPAASTPIPAGPEKPFPDVSCA